MSPTRLALSILSCVGALAAPVIAQRSTLKHALPADTIAFVSLPDLDKSVQELLEMPLLRMWRQDEMQQFIAPALVELNKKWHEGLEQAKAMHEQGDLPFAPDDLLQLRLYGATVAVTHAELVGDGSPMPDIGLVLHLDFGPSAPIWRKIIDFGLEQMEADAGDQLEKSESQVSGIKLTTWQPPMVPMSLNLAWVGDGIVLGTSQKVITSTLGALIEKKKVLTEAAAYKVVAANVEHPGAEIEVFGNVQRGLRSFFGLLAAVAANEPNFPSELSIEGIERAVGALGLDAVKAFGATSTYDGNKAVSRSYVACPAPERRGLVADGSKNLDLDALKWVPKKAVACSATTINPTAVWDALVDAFKAYDEKLAEAQLAHLAALEKNLGFSIRDDLCGSFGDQMVTWSMPMQGLPGMGMGGGSLFNGMILVQMRDKDRLLKCLQGLKQAAGGSLEFDSNTRDDLTTYFVKLSGDVLADMFEDAPFNPGMLLEMVTPVFAFQDDYMVLGFSRADVRRTVKAMAAGVAEADSLRANKAFADVLGQLDASRLVALSFSDNRATFDNLYNIAYGFTHMVPEDVPLDLAKLPDEGGFLSQHLFPSVSYSYTDGNGFSSHATGPLGPEIGVIVGVAIAAAVTVGINAGRMR